LFAEQKDGNTEKKNVKKNKRWLKKTFFWKCLDWNCSFEKCMLVRKISTIQKKKVPSKWIGDTLTW
jgi:hypothetical protein